MEHGTNCTLPSCIQLSFLPLSCPFCQQIFCEFHFLPAQHTCQAPSAEESGNVLTAKELTRRVLRANPGSAAGHRLPCKKRACKAFSLQVNLTSRSAAGTEPVQYKAPSCHRCEGLFCVKHRSPGAHDCSAPEPQTEGQQRMAAAEERKRKARELIAKNFPNKEK